MLLSKYSSSSEVSLCEPPAAEKSAAPTADRGGGGGIIDVVAATAACAAAAPFVVMLSRSSMPILRTKYLQANYENLISWARLN